VGVVDIDPGQNPGAPALWSFGREGSPPGVVFTTEGAATFLGVVTVAGLVLPAAATTESVAYLFEAPAGALTRAVLRAPKAGTVAAVHGYRVGGSGATINALVNATDLLAVDLSLAVASTWTSGPAIAAPTLAAGDTISLSVRSVAGGPTYVVVQVDWQAA
jgi:hypothetical protein